MQYILNHAKAGQRHSFLHSPNGVNPNFMVGMWHFSIDFQVMETVKTVMIHRSHYSPRFKSWAINECILN